MYRWCRCTGRDFFTEFLKIFSIESIEGLIIDFCHPYRFSQTHWTKDVENAGNKPLEKLFQV